MGEAILWIADRGSRNPGAPSDLLSSFCLFPKNGTEHSCLAKSLEFWSRSRSLLCAWKDGVFPRAFTARLARPTHARDPGTLPLLLWDHKAQKLGDRPSEPRSEVTERDTDQFGV